MKAIFKFSIFVVALLLTTFSSLLFVSCEKEAVVIQPPPPPVTPDYPTDRPHEVEDLVAWYNPLNNTLLADPAFTKDVLSLLDAQPALNGSYAAMGVNANLQPVPLHFLLLETPASSIATQAATVPLTPDLVATITEKGTTFRVYKNAECGKIEKGFEGACENLTGGTSTKNVWYELKRCGRGNGFCTEALAVGGRKVVYINANCQGPIQKEESYFMYQCW